MPPDRSLTQTQGGSSDDLKDRQDGPQKCQLQSQLITMELTGVDTVSSQLLPSCSISNTSGLSEYITVLWGQALAALPVWVQ